jgi:hypothetical protein
MKKDDGSFKATNTILCIIALLISLLATMNCTQNQHTAKKDDSKLVSLLATVTSLGTASPHKSPPSLAALTVNVNDIKYVEQEAGTGGGGIRRGF